VKLLRLEDPGGEWQGIEYQVRGAPEFEEGEDSLLFLKKTGFGFRVQNLALSKYDISYKRDEILFQSVVYRDHPRLGNFNLVELNSLLRERFNATLEEIPQFSVAIRRNKSSRSIASYDGPDSLHTGSPTERVPMFGLGMIFILLGGLRKKIFWFWRKYL